MPVGAGALDARGVHQFGEDDTQGLASDLHNIGQVSISTQFGVDRTRMTAIETRATVLETQRTCRRRTTGTLASSGSYAALTLSTAVVGSKFTHATGVFTCQEAGTYLITFSASFAANATGLRGLRLLGSAALGERATPLATGVSASVVTSMTVTWLVVLAVNDTITTQGIQNSGSALTVLGEIMLERIV